MITFKQRGSFDKTTRYLKRVKNINFKPILDRYGRDGVRLLSESTPVDSGVTSNSWNYKIDVTPYGFSLKWFNNSTKNGVPIVILLHYGHGTTGGSYVTGRDFINPVMRPLFDKISNDLWKEVERL